jgi:excisionase family DNA binding protein
MGYQWLTVKEVAQHARCGVRVIYDGVASGKLRAARLGGRRELRFLVEWIDAWLLASATPEIINPSAPGDAADRDRLNSATHRDVSTAAWPQRSESLQVRPAQAGDVLAPLVFLL